MAREPMVPASLLATVIAENRQAQADMLEMVRTSQREMVEALSDTLGKHLAEVAESYRKALEPPPLPAMPVPSLGALHMTEEEEETRWQLDEGLITLEQAQERLKNLGLNVELHTE